MSTKTFDTIGVASGTLGEDGVSRVQLVATGEWCSLYPAFMHVRVHGRGACPILLYFQYEIANDEDVAR